MLDAKVKNSVNVLIWYPECAHPCANWLNTEQLMYNRLITNQTVPSVTTL